MMRKDELEALESHLVRINDHRHSGGLDKGAQLLERAVEERYLCAERLAVYGSLAPGKENHHVVSHLGGRWLAAQIRGDLFDQGWGSGLGYPAMRWRPQGSTITVDLLESPSLATNWEEIDRFEGSGYVRILVPVLLDGAFYCVANIYELAREKISDPEPRWIMETPRLGLREMTWDDLDYLATLMADPEVMRYFPAPLDRDQTEAWIARQRDRYRIDGVGYWLAIERSSSRAVGQIGVLMTELGGDPEPALGYIVERRSWGRGFASEGARACIEWIFAHTAHPRAITLVRPENEPSHSVAVRVGMIECGTVIFAGLEHRIYSIDRPDPESSA